MIATIGGIGRRTAPPTAGGGGSFATPDLIDHASFETGFLPLAGSTSGVGFGSTSGGSSITQGIATSFGRTTDQAYSGSYSVNCGWGPTVAEGNLCDWWCFTGTPGYDELWTAVYFKATGTVPSVATKFLRWQAVSIGNCGGLFLYPNLGNGTGGLVHSFDIEDSAQINGLGKNAAGTTISSSVVFDGNWHCLETHYKRNGDASGFPTVEFWWDGTHTTWPDSTPQVGVTKQYWNNNILYAGERNSSQKLDRMEILNTMNANNASTGNIWLDVWSWSHSARCGNLTA